MNDTVSTLTIHKEMNGYIMEFAFIYGEGEEERVQCRKRDVV